MKSDQSSPTNRPNPSTQKPSEAQSQQEAQSDKQQVQGEGDYRANERYTESVKDFVDSGKVDEAARKAKPDTQHQAEELRRAEKEGASHAKGGKPQHSDTQRK